VWNNFGSILQVRLAQLAFSFCTRFFTSSFQVFTIMKISIQAIFALATFSGTNANSGGAEFTGVSQQECELAESNSVWHDGECVCKEKHLPASFLSGGVISLIPKVVK
jgi:hypothetical protein